MYIENEFSLLEVGAKKPEYFIRNILITLDELDKFRASHNNIDIYRTVYFYNDKNQDESSLYGPMYFDLDKQELKDELTEAQAFDEIREDAKKIIAILEAIFYIPCNQIEIYFSGGKGLHIVVPPSILGIHPRKDLNNIYRIIATDIKKYLGHQTMDTKIYDNKRLFRLPNSIHSSTGLHKIPITADELRILSFADIKLLASKERQVQFDTPIYNTRANMMYRKFVDQWEDELRKIEERKNKGTGTGKWHYTPPCIGKLLEEGVKEGSRNNTIALLASHYKQGGLTEAETLNRLEQFNQTLLTPSLPAREIDRTVTSVFAGEYKYGCRTLVDMGLCVPECKILQKRSAK